MALLQRLMKPQAGERIEVYKNGKLLIRGLVTLADNSIISISDKNMNVINFDPAELTMAISNREIRIKKIKHPSS